MELSWILIKNYSIFYLFCQRVQKHVKMGQKWSKMSQNNHYLILFDSIWPYSICFVYETNRLACFYPFQVPNIETNTKFFWNFFLIWIRHHVYFSNALIPTDTIPTMSISKIRQSPDDSGYILWKWLNLWLEVRENLGNWRFGKSTIHDMDLSGLVWFGISAFGIKT